MLEVWEERSFEIIVSANGHVHLLGRIVKSPSSAGCPFEACGRSV